MAMTPDQAVTALTKVNEVLVKISSETESLLNQIEDLEKALADAIAGGGAITPELEAAVKEVAVTTHTIDELVADAQPPPE